MSRLAVLKQRVWEYQAMARLSLTKTWISVNVMMEGHDGKKDERKVEVVVVDIA